MNFNGAAEINVYRELNEISQGERKTAPERKQPVNEIKHGATVKLTLVPANNHHTLLSYAYTRHI
jgi:hypothetical protein